MKNYAKVGNRNGKPGYRTSAVFRYRKYVEISRLKKEASKKKHLR